MNNAASTTDLLSVIVRVLGVVMLLIGLFIGIKVICEAWDLYKQPQSIERFADAIEQGSHLDSMLAKFTPKPKATENDSDDRQSLQITDKNTDSLRLTYFIAWIVAIVLLMIIGSLAFGAIKTGGQLALYDLEVKRFARQLMTEARKTIHDD